MHLIIIGGVAAGCKAAARARRVNPELRISLYQEESEVAYTACGQPYYLSGLIADRHALIIRKPAEFAAQGIQIKIRHRVLEINAKRQTLKVHNLESDQISRVAFDRLIIATGAHSIKPEIPGTRLDGVVSLRNLAELDRFQRALDHLQPSSAVIVGSGYIGLELAESLTELGITVTLLGRNKQVFSRLDREMSQQVHDYLIKKNICVMTADEITEILGKDGRVTAVKTRSGISLSADLVVLALGIQPNIHLAAQAGINLGNSGAIAVDEHMQTSIKDIFAAGDCAESYHRLTGLPVWEPLGDIANLQGRVAGENAAGGDTRFPGVLGSAICKSFDLNIGMTGLSEKAAVAAGFEVASVVINARDKARYYPSARELTLKLVAEVNTGQLLGAQAVGCGAVDKSIDIAATALLGKLSCDDLQNADLAYAPPFSPVLSPIIIAAGALHKKIAR